MLTFEHANSVCTGSQLIIDIDRSDNDICGAVSLSIRPQITAPSIDGNGNKTYAEFGDEGSIWVALDIKQVIHILAVLEGKADSILGGKGLFVKDEASAITIHADKVTGRPSGYSIHLKERRNGRVVDQRILLNHNEATTIVKSLNAVFGYLAFGE